MLVRITSDTDPRRCQYKGGIKDQCYFVADEGSKFCARHRVPELRDQEKENIRLYLVAKYQEKIGFQADHPSFKSIREEIGILRMTIETQLNKVQDDDDLLMRSGKILELVREVGNLQRISAKLERETGVTIDINQAKIWIQEVGTILMRYIGDPEILKMISEDLIGSLSKHFNRPS